MGQQGAEGRREERDNGNHRTDGFEETFAINHLGHFLLTKPLVWTVSEQLVSL